MVEIPRREFNNHTAYRLINSKFPPIDLFDDVADGEEFEALYALQAKTNPRLLIQLGKLNLVPDEERPYGISGFNYAMGPFVHINPNGSRFSDGAFGVYYAAKNIETAIAETKYHQEKYFKKVDGLKFDRIVMRSLKTTFTATLLNIKQPYLSEYHEPDNYSRSQFLGNRVKQEKIPGICYGSVRLSLNECFALFSPKYIDEVIQCGHYEYLWNGEKIDGINRLSSAIAKQSFS